jgi:hypothetical protein
VDVEHLYGGKLFEHGPRGQAAGAWFQTGLEGDLQAVGKERDEPKGGEPLRRIEEMELLTLSASHKPRH